MGGQCPESSVLRVNICTGEHLKTGVTAGVCKNQNKTRNQIKKITEVSVQFFLYFMTDREIKKSQISVLKYEKGCHILFGLKSNQMD